jgi:hypothetical protein
MARTGTSESQRTPTSSTIPEPVSIATARAAIRSLPSQATVTGCGAATSRIDGRSAAAPVSA